MTRLFSVELIHRELLLEEGGGQSSLGTPLWKMERHGGLAQHCRPWCGKGRLRAARATRWSILEVATETSGYLPSQVTWWRNGSGGSFDRSQGEHKRIHLLSWQEICSLGFWSCRHNDFISFSEGRLMALTPGPVWTAISFISLSVVNSGMPAFP